MSAKKIIVMVGPSISSQGGITSVVMSWKCAGLFERWPITYLETHVEGSKLNKLWVGISAFWRLLLFLALKRVACVHVHVARRNSFWRKAIFAMAAIVMRRPVLFHLHSGGFPVFFHDECNWVQKQAIRLVLSQADQLIVLSSNWHELLQSITPNPRITIIENFFSALSPQPLGGPREKHLLLFLGLLTKEKGFYDLLDAISLLCDEFPTLILACGGKGNQLEVHDRINQLQIETRVHLLGWISGQDKEPWFSRASIFVLPSYIEGMPMAIIEAMAWGLPIVSTKIGGIPDIVENGREGFLLEPGDIDGFCNAIRQLLRNDVERERMGCAAREKIERKFSVKAIVPKVNQLYGRYC